MAPPSTATAAAVAAPPAAPPCRGVADAAAAAVAAARAASASSPASAAPAAAAAAARSRSWSGAPAAAAGATAVRDCRRGPPLPPVTLSTLLSIPELACLIYDHLAGVPFTSAPPVDPDSPGPFSSALTLSGAAAVAPLAATCRAARAALRPAVRTLSLSAPPASSPLARTLLGGGGGGGGGGSAGDDGGNGRAGQLPSGMAAMETAAASAAISDRRADALGRLLRTFPALRCLSAVRVGWVDAAALAAVATAAPALEALRLVGLPPLPASAVAALARLPRLAHLNLGYPFGGSRRPYALPGGTSPEVAAEMRLCEALVSLPALTSLSLSGHALSLAAVDHLGSAGRLRRLWLTGASMVSPAVVRALAASRMGRTLTHLWVAGINGGSGFTDAHMVALAPAMALQELHLGYALSLTDAGLNAVVAAGYAPSLRVLTLEGGVAESVTREGLAAARAALPACQLRISGERVVAMGEGGGWVDGWHP